MNLKDSINLIGLLFGRHVARQQPSKHLGSKRARLSKAAIRGRRKRQRQARKIQQRTK